MSKASDITIELARAVLQYEKAHRVGRPRSEQVDAHAELIRLAAMVRKWAA